MDYLPYLLAALLLFANVAAWLTNLLTLPGNWAILLFAALYAWLLPADLDPRLSWWVVGAAAVLALVGEAIEFFAGAAGAKKQGGSRRGMVLSLLLTFVGSIVGAAIGAPVPVIGLLIGALAGAGIGAFAGAYLGEWWVGRKHQERVDISAGALVGRMLGTVGKLAIGIAMIVMITFDSFIDLS
jgi:uncharacterized protein YqgC (DUF456 family)